MTFCVLSWDRCLSSEATRFSVYDCTPTTCQKPCFAAGELGEDCGNKGFGGFAVFPKFEIWGAGQGLARGPHVHAYPRIVKDREGCYGLPMVLMVFPSMSAVAPPKALAIASLALCV